MDQNTKERYILAGVALHGEEEAFSSLEELSALLDTAGGETVFEVIQNLDHPNPATYIGKGKAEELAELVEQYEATGIICDDELSPTQMKNLSDIIGAKVIDRTVLILDIFAAHAMTGEGKLQVEMAQQKYRLSHLQGTGTSLSRLGGGIGTRGPGETKLETDRRRIKSRISSLSHEIEQMKKMRETTRKRRLNSNIPIVAIIGYTNAGKSTLLNRLTKSDVLAENKLFATLDPTTRKYRSVSGRQILFTDTVGFINKLPHHLIDAFRSTLEEAVYADVILHVVDASDENADMHMEIVYETLRELGVEGKPVICAFNKTDIVNDDSAHFHDKNADKSVRISAKTGEGIADLISVVEDFTQQRGSFHG